MEPTYRVTCEIPYLDDQPHIDVPGILKLIRSELVEEMKSEDVVDEKKKAIADSLLDAFIAIQDCECKCKCKEMIRYPGRW